MNKPISGRTEVNVTTTIEACHECYGRGKVKHLLNTSTSCSFADFDCDFCKGSGRIVKTISTATDIKAFEEE
jgi:DnaJ-class molecular chaperone